MANGTFSRGLNLHFQTNKSERLRRILSVFVENALAMLNIRVMTHPRSPFMVRQAHQPGGSGRRIESGFADAISDWSRLTNRAVPVAGPRAGSRTPPRTGAGSPTGRFRSPDRERVRGRHLGLEQTRQPGGSGRWTESGFADAISYWSRLINRAVPVAGPAEARSNIATYR